MAYDSNNIFARILRGEIPTDKVYEDDFSYAFRDINPQADVHVLVVPKGEYVSAQDFHAQAPAELLAGFYRAVSYVADEMGVVAPGYRLIANHGAHAHQEVPHYHIHILGGRPLGPMLDSRFG